MIQGSIDTKLDTTKRTWNRGRRRRLAWSILLSLLTAALIILLIDPAKTSSLKRGDFPAFYSAGQILLRDQDSRLYEYELQAKIQNEYWPSLAGEFYPYSYPPYVAVAYEQLAKLPPASAKAIVLALGALAFCLVVFELLRLYPSLRPARFEISVMLLCWAPLLSGLAAGQNTIFTLLLMILIADLGGRPGRKNELLCGTALFALCFKPHYAVLPGLILVAAGRFRPLAIAAMEFAALYLLTALRFGLDWPMTWVAAVSRFAVDDKVANQHLMVSLNGFLDAVAENFIGPAAGYWPTYLALGFSALAVGRILLRARKIGAQASQVVYPIGEDANHRHGPELGAEISKLLLLSGPVIALVSTHTLYYDAALALLPLPAALGALANADRSKSLSDRSVFILLGTWVLVFLLVLIKDRLPAQPLALLLVGWVAFLMGSASFDKARLENSRGCPSDSAKMGTV
jgi:hypothetical protein